MYLALYRRFRPETFEQVVGQDHIIRTLKNQILNDQVGHAYLFCGSRGTGKTSVAKIFAKAVNCENTKDGSPCLACKTCKQLTEANSVDIIEIDAASNNRVDEVRDIRDKVKYPPLYGKYKVYIIDEVHMLTDSAFNALLKTLEEPPAHIIFILATTEPQKLPATILSRVLRFDFKLVGLDNLTCLLENIFKQSGIKAEHDAITEIAKAGNGSVRDTLSIADMCASFSNNNIKFDDVLEVLGTSNQEVLFNLADSVLSGNIENFVEVFDHEVKSGRNIVSLALDLTKEFRDILVLKIGGTNSNIIDLPEDVKNKLKSVSAKYEISRINQALQAFSQIEADLKYATNPQLLVEVTAMKLLGSSQSIKNQSSQNIIKNIPISNEEMADLSETNSILSMKKSQIQNPHKIWGQVLIALHDKNVVLHSACVGISNVEIIGDNFNIFVESESLAEIMKKKENYADLVAQFKEFGYNYNIVINKCKAVKQVDKTKLISEKLGVSVHKK